MLPLTRLPQCDEERPWGPRSARLEKLEPSDSDYKKISAKFQMTVKHKITDIFRISNPPLQILFESVAARMAKEGRFIDASKRKNVGANEQLLFHSTSRAAAGGIIREGFDIRRSGAAHGQVLGPGIYLSPNASTAHFYSAADSIAKRSMLVCRALLGDTGGRDSVMSGDEYCVSRECQVLPVWLIHYQS
jgi:hypothetical protein